MSIKDNFIYKSAKAAYLSYVHFVCDVKRKPLINPLKECLLNLDFGGVKTTISISYQ